MNQQVTYDRIMQTAMGFWGSKTLMSAVELGIFDTLAGGPLDAKALRLRVGVHERSARDFFGALPAWCSIWVAAGRRRSRVSRHDKVECVRRARCHWS